MFKQIFSFCLTLIIFLGVLVSGAGFATANDLDFFEDNNCQGRLLFGYSADEYVGDNCNKGDEICSGENDEARSLEVRASTHQGTYIEVFDSPDHDHDHDYANIFILATVPNEGVCVGTFENDYIYQGVAQVDFHKEDDGDLDGKVSYIRITT